MFRDKFLICDYFKKIFEDIKRGILTQEDNFMIQTNKDELVEYYFTKYCLSPIEFDKSKEESFQHKKELRVVPAHKREDIYQNMGDIEFEFETITVKLPIIPNNNLQTILNLQSSIFSISGSPKVHYLDDSISFRLDIKGYGFELDDDKIAFYISQKKDAIDVWIRRKNDDIKKENEILKSKIDSYVEARKKKLAEDKERMKTLVQSMNIPLRNEEEELIRKIKLDAKPLIKKVEATSNKFVEFELDRKKVIDIISFIDNQGRQFENTPNTFKNFKEEDFRNTLLVSLNSIFRGKATGETFSKKGKTDIYLIIDNGNILIFECKIWGGKSRYAKTINQLLKYLTWRNNFGIIVTFVRRRDFSKVIEAIEDIVINHQSFKTNFQKLSKTHFVSIHRLREDKFKNVEIHHLFYNLHVLK